MQEVKDRSDRLMNYFLAAYFIVGLIFASFYDTWFIAIGVGGLSLVAYYSVKLALPESDLYQYVLSAVLGIFMAQFIYQMHGLFEMHFVAFLGSAILITYQNWKLQIPMLLLVAAHHASFGYLQNIGFEKIYFTQLDALTVQTFVIHIILAGIIFLVCGLWAYQLKKYNGRMIVQTIEMAKLQKEAQLSIERQRNEETLEKTNRELRKSNRELDKFVYSVSHDLRAPLTSMLGLIEISEEGVEDEFLQNNLDYLKTSIHKLDGFIGDILNYSRNSRMEVVPEEVNFGEMLLDIVNNVRYMHKNRREVEIKVSRIGDAPFASDKRRLNIVLSNLVCNAIRYQDVNKSEPSISIAVDTTPGQAIIVVKDNGIGIKKEFHCKIFEMFYRVSNASEGSGLGLYIVHQIIEKLGGTVHVESEIGKGTSFIICLPNCISQTTNIQNSINNQSSDLCTAA